MYRSPLLAALEWLDHGFGTRHSPGWPSSGPLATLKQVHSNQTVMIENVDGCAGEGDALITATPGQWIAVRTADCVPVLLAAESRPVVAAIHAGWRGSAANIVAQTVERLQRDFGVAPAELRAAIGPAIGPCCYEVGRDVAGHFRKWLDGLKRVGEKVMLDLPAANRRQLLAAGVRQETISSAALCTCCHPGEFYSYRRDPSDPGRMRSAVAVRG